MKAHIMAILFFGIACAIMLIPGEMTIDQKVGFWGALVCSQAWGAAAFIRESKR